MTIKSQISNLAESIGERAENWPRRMDHTRAALAGWANGALRFARRNPGVTLLGAFVVGYSLAKAARHA